MKEAIGIQVTFMLEIKIQKYIFSKFWALFQRLMSTFCTTIRMGIYIRMPQPKIKIIKNKSLAVNSQNIKQEMGIQVTFISEKKLQREQFLPKYECFFHRLMRPFCIPVRMCMCIRTAQVKNWKKGIWGK